MHCVLVHLRLHEVVWLDVSHKSHENSCKDANLQTCKNVSFHIPVNK